MINKINRKKPAPLLRTPALTPYFHPFFNFSDSPPPEEVIKIYFFPFEKKGGGPNYAINIYNYDK